ncbi:hypothetical protein Nmel_015243, partial [Mimus melanotis]
LPPHGQRHCFPTPPLTFSLHNDPPQNPPPPLTQCQSPAATPPTAVLHACELQCEQSSWSLLPDATLQTLACACRPEPCGTPWVDVPARCPPALSPCRMAPFPVAACRVPPLFRGARFPLASAAPHGPEPLLPRSCPSPRLCSFQRLPPLPQLRSDQLEVLLETNQQLPEAWAQGALLNPLRDALSTSIFWQKQIYVSLRVPAANVSLGC